jgi:hypothetical protein
MHHEQEECPVKKNGQVAAWDESIFE